jgi:hypothetical protein
MAPQPGKNHLDEGSLGGVAIKKTEPAWRPALREENSFKFSVSRTIGLHAGVFLFPAKPL